LENPQSAPLLRNYAACRGAWGATNPKVASLRKELAHAADRRSLGNPRRRRLLGGRNRGLVPGERSSTRVMPVAHHPAASACTMKFSPVYSHRTIAGGSGHNLPQEAVEAVAEAVFQAGGRGR
jgi:hypothetical protein